MKTRAEAKKERNQHDLVTEWAFPSGFYRIVKKGKRYIAMQRGRRILGRGTTLRNKEEQLRRLIINDIGKLLTMHVRRAGRLSDAMDEVRFSDKIPDNYVMHGVVICDRIGIDANEKRRRPR